MYKSPISYNPGFIPGADAVFDQLWNELVWRTVAGNRLEYYCNDFQVAYTYGAGAGVRSYDPQPWHPAILAIRSSLEALTKTPFEVCFLNGYRGGKDALGWHSDNSPEMDDARPIAIVSLGARREIYFRPIPGSSGEAGLPGPADQEIEKLWLDNGSLCLMSPGMQDTHQHKIPKASYEGCGPRISLTFRGYVSEVS